jgi:hypothetical protein
MVQPGEGESVSIPGFGAVYQLYSRGNGGEVAIVEHPFAVGYLTAPHWHTREDEHSIVVEGEIGFRSDDAEVALGRRPGRFSIYPDTRKLSLTENRSLTETKRSDATAFFPPGCDLPSELAALPLGGPTSAVRPRHDAGHAG